MLLLSRSANTLMVWKSSAKTATPVGAVVDDGLALGAGLLVVVATDARGRVREPLERHLGQDLLGRDEAGAVAEGHEQLVPGELARGESEMPTAIGLRPAGVDRVVAADRLEPLHVRQTCVLGRRQVLELGRVAGGEREQLQDVQAEEALGPQQAELAAHQGAGVAAVHAVAVVPEATHQGVEHDRDLRERPPGLVDGSAETEAGNRGDDDREGVLGAAAVRDRVDERSDQVEEVDERARVGVDQQQRRRVGFLGRDVDEVDGLVVDLGQVVRELVHPRLLGAPVEGRGPVVDRVAKVGVRGRRTPSRRRAPAGGDACGRGGP